MDEPTYPVQPTDSATPATTPPEGGPIVPRDDKLGWPQALGAAACGVVASAPVFFIMVFIGVLIVSFGGGIDAVTDLADESDASDVFTTLFGTLAALVGVFVVSSLLALPVMAGFFCLFVRLFSQRRVSFRRAMLAAVAGWAGWLAGSLLDALVIFASLGAAGFLVGVAASAYVLRDDDSPA